MAIFNTQWCIRHRFICAVFSITAVLFVPSLSGLYAADTLPPLVIGASSSDSLALCGDTIEVKVRVVSGFEGITALGFELNWDSTLLKLIGVETIGLIGLDSVFVGSPINGNCTFSWLEEAFDGETVSDNTMLFSLKFVAINNAGTTNVRVNDDPTYYDVLNSLFEELTLSAVNDVMVTTSKLSLTVGQGPAVPFGVSNAVLSYSGTTGTPDIYSIDYSDAAEAEGFIDVADEPLLPNQVDLEIPPMGTPGSYEATLLVRNSITGCSSTPQTFFINKLTERLLSLKMSNLGSDSLTCGDTLCVAVQVDTGFTDLAIFGVNIAWDTSYLSVIQLEADTLNGEFFVSANDTVGIVGYSWIDDDFMGVDLPNDFLLLLIKFRVKNADGDPGLVFSDSPAPEALNNSFETVSVVTENNLALTVEGVGIDFSAYTIVGLGIVVAELPFSSASGNPNMFSIDFGTDAETAGFIDTANALFTSSPVSFAVPPNAPPGFYQGVIWASNGLAGCSSEPDTFTIEISPYEQVELFATGPDDVLCDTFIEIDITTGNGFNGLSELKYSVNWSPSQLSFINYTLNPDVEFVSIVGTDSTLVYTLISPGIVNYTLDSGEVLLTLQMEVVGRSGIAHVDITDVPQVKEALNEFTGIPPVVAFNQVAIDLTPVAITPDTALVVCQGTVTAELAYTDALNAPDQYSIDFDGAAESNGFVDVVWETLPPGTIVVELPTDLPFGVYHATVQVKNVLEDCSSVAYPISITVNETPEAEDLSVPICSDDTLAVDLQGQIVNGALNVLFVWSATDNPNVLGETVDTSFGAFISDILVNTSTVSQTVVYKVTPSGGAGCPGMPFEVMVTVNPVPVLDVPMNPIRVCSDEALDYVLETDVPAAFDIISVTIPNALTPATGNATIPAFNVGADYLAADAYTNLAPGGRLVTYQVVPVSEDGCVGDTGTVVFRILAEPQMEDAKDTVCAGEPIGLEFGVISGSFQADGYELVSVTLDPGLTAGSGNAVPGDCLDSSAIAQDVFFNPNNTVLNVVYTVRPLRGCVQGLACAGDAVDITICIQPAPAGVDPELMICSADTLLVDLSDLITNNVGGLTFEWFAVDNDSVIGESNGLQSSSLINDVLVNTTITNQTVVYCIIPTEGFGCTGDTFKVTTIVKPVPVLFEPVNPIAACSDEALNYDFTVDGASVPAATFDIVSVLINSPLIAAAGNAAVPAFGVGADYLAADAYTNLAPGGRLVTYQVVPVSADGCVGDTGTVVFRILAEPQMEDVKDTVCTGDPIGVEFGVIGGSFQADGYELVSVTLDAGLTADAGNAVPGVCLDSSAIAQDVFFNPMNAVLNVVYKVRPLRGCIQGRDCAGDTVTISICISPAPQGENNTVEICAGDALAVDLSATINNGITATNFTWFALADDPDVSGETLAPVQSGFISDVLTNTGAETDTVVYEVTAVGIGGCAGQPWYISVVVHPLPVLFVPVDDPNVCSDSPLGSNFGGFAAAPGSVAATSFVINNVSVQTPLTASPNNLMLPFGPAPGDAVNGDVYTNLTGGARKAVYSVTPVSAFGCPGESTAFSFQIRAEPQMAPDTIDVCSNETLDYVLNTIAGSFAANGYELIAVVADSNLIAGVGNATAGSCQPDTLLKNDTWYNPTTDALSVVYTVRPQRGCPIGNPGQDCNGDSVELVVSVSGQPQPLCPSDIEVVTSLDGIGDCQTDLTLNHPTLNGACLPVALEIDFASGDPAPDSLPTGQSVVPGGADIFNFDAGETIITYTVTDGFSNTGTCSFTVMVTDDEAPEISCPPSDTISTDPGLCVAINPGLTTPATSDNCGVEGVVDNAPDTLQAGTTLILFTVSDQSGNTASCTQTVVVEDDEAPMIACADTLEVNTDPASCFAFGVSLTEPTTTDNCSAVTVTNNAPTQLSLGFNNVTYTATDQSGNSAFCSLVVEVKDSEPPTIECPDDVEVNTLQGLCYATTVPLNPAVVNDNCPNLVVVNNAPNLYPLGPTDLTYTVTDAGGNTATCITVVTVVDNQLPVIVCPANTTVDANANCQATGVSIGLPQVSENCTISSISNDAPGVFPVGTTQIVFVATDNSGNTGTCIKTVTVLDNTPPTIVCPGNITASTAPGLCTAAQLTLGNPTVDDNCPGAGFSVDLPTTYPLGTTVVLYTATDNSGNTATCTQLVAVNDLEPPMIICPTPVTLNTDLSACTSTNPPIGMTTASDNCAIDTINSSKPGTFALGATVVSYQAIDVDGNSASCTQMVTVIDQEKPILTACPANISVNAPSGVCTATVNWNPPTATDNCTGVQTNSTHQPGSVFQTGQTTVVYTVTDGANNTASCSFVVTVRDQQPPVLSACPGNINMGNTPNACGANVNWTPPTASDNCGNVVLTTNHNPGAFFGIGQTNVVYTATDASGNTAVCTFSIRVNDTQAPTLICPANITVNTPANDCFASAVWTIPTPTDNCPGAVISNATHQSGSSFQLGTTTVRYTAVDAAGTSVTCSFTVTVVDNVPPKAVCLPTFTINLNGNGIATLNPVLLNAGSTDNCGISVYTAQPELFTCTQVGVQVVTLVVSDNAGNTASCTTSILVNASPVCTPPVMGNSGGPNIHDPCFCIGNGRFSEEVVIGPAGSGQAWRVSSTTLINPATSLPYPVGTLFSEVPLGGGQSLYVLAGVHIDGVGYTVAAQSPFYPGTTLSIGNTCSYPDATIVAGDQGPYCQFTAPVTFTGSANGGIGGVGQFLVDNVPVPTVQNPPNSGNWVAVVNVGSLSAGSHTLTFNFDAGNPAGQLPPANIGCTATENLIFEVSPAPSVLVCNQLTTVVLGGTCLETITPDDVLSTSVGCIDDYIVTIVGPNGQIGNTVNGLNIGQTLAVTVTNLVNGSSCTGALDVIDINGPDLVCPDVFVPCILTETDPLTLLNLSIPNAFPVAMDNCSAVNDFDFADQLFDLGCSGTINNQTNLSAYILRTWTAKDEYGNSGQCQQFVYLQRLPVSQVQFPPNTSVSCAEVADPDITGTPFVTVGGTVFPVYPDAGVCELTTVYTDVILPGTGCNTQTIQRTWSVFGTCQPGSVNPPNFNPRLVTQVIQVTDNTGPVVDCPADITADANSGNCCASVNLPDVVVSDPCSRVNSARALVIRIDPQTGDTLFVFTVAGALTNFPGNDPQDPDTLASYGTTTCLPIGQYRIVYLAEDVCGNIGSCAFNLRVGDLTPPNAVCAAVQSVTLNAQGQASLNATSFNNGSTDNCGAVAFKARRQDAALCQGNNQFFDNVLFCCEDVGDTAFVVLRVYDVPVPAGSVALNFEQVHATDCIARVLVRDTVAPTCAAPNDTVVTCGTYTPDLGNFSDAAASDNCCLDTLLETLDLAQFDTICKRGIIQRTFTAVDCDGNSSVCRQNIQFDYIQTYVIQFPDDVVAPACSTSGLFGEPEFFLNNCENLDVSFTDVSVSGPSGQCSRVERTWRIVNLCTYVPTLPLTVVPNPQPDDDPIFADNLPGPIVSPVNTPSPWMPTVVALTPGAQPTNFSQYWSSNSNGYAYTQYIYVVDDIDPVAVTACPTDTVRIGDASTNDPGLWNASFWFDPLNTSNDLCEATAALSFSAEDNCGGNLLDLRYELFLDLDGNGTQETVVKSDSLPAVNTVQFNNLASGNVNGGTARAFDQRGLPVNQQYRFALEKTVAGNQVTAQVRWNTTAAANVFSAPQLPNGIHRIRWIAEDACGNSSSCAYVFTLRDTLPPTLVCQGGTFNLGPGGVYNLLTSSLFSSATDNCTPQNKLNFSMRIVGSGNGFPLNPQGFPVTQLAFDCGDLGTQNIELWVADAAFNTRVCTTAVIIDDAVGFCSSTFYDAGGNIKSDKLVNYEGAEMSVSGMHPSGFAFANTDVTGTDGNYLWSNIAPDGAMYTVKPFADDNHLNGVFTSDLVFIQNHILQKDTLDTPYRVIAADANKSGSVTGLDITEIRKLILGINSKFPKNTSWRFVDKTWVFNNILNPFSPVFPETITIDPATMDELTLDFVALKVGDANGSALPNNLVSIDDRTAGQMAFEVETDEPIGDRQLLAGETVLVRIRPAEPVAGYQFTLSHEGLELLELLPGTGMALDHFGVFPDKAALTTSWDGKTGGTFALRLRVLESGQLSDLLRVSGSITPAQAYRSINERPLDVALSFSETGLVQTPDFELYQNRPNPFNGVTWIGFYLPEATVATLRILDETGRLVYMRHAEFDKGEQYITLTADELGATGVMYYELTTPTNRAVKKMVRVER